MLRKSEPYMPSFGQVITQNTGTVLRLPAYRSSYQTRYHPYPRYNQHVPRDPFMDSVDYRTDDSSHSFSPVVNPIVEEEEGTEGEMVGNDNVGKDDENIEKVVQNVEKLDVRVRQLSDITTAFALRFRVKSMWERFIRFEI